MALVVTVASFDGVDGFNPNGSLVLDANGDLIGTAFSDTSASDSGTVFEVARMAGGYASTPTVLFHFPGSFNGNGDSGPQVGVLLDAAGDLFGAVPYLGDAGSGSTVFELANTGAGFASATTTLASFNGTTSSALAADAAGDLFGTTFAGGAGGQGTVFEMAKTASGYAAPVVLDGGFTSTSGAEPQAGLYVDTNADLFGTTTADGMFNAGTVFEIAHASTGYASAPVALVSFNGFRPAGSLIADGAGDLFGTTNGSGGGAVFEVAKTPTGFATAPVALASFSGVLTPYGALTIDANGDLFGMTSGSGMDSHGVFVTGSTVFEIVHTAAGYASTPVTVASFSGPGGNGEGATLLADAAGDLFGVTLGGGAHGDGSVFEIMESGFRAAPSDLLGPGNSNFLIENAAGSVVVGDIGANDQAGYTQISALGPEWTFAGIGAFLGDGDQGFVIESTAGAVVVGEVRQGAAVYTQVAALGPEWKFVGTGDLLGDGGQGFLIQNPAGAVVVGEVHNGAAVYTQVAALGPEWTFVGTGDFLGDGKSDFLIENTAGAVVVGEVHHGAAAYTQVAALGPEWKFVGTGDFLGDDKDDFLIENASGAVAIGEVVNGAVVYQDVAGLGPEWKFVGAGEYLGEGHDQFLIENQAGAVVVGDWTGGQVHFIDVGALGQEWTFH